jgi:hypothetical protein
MTLGVENETMQPGDNSLYDRRNEERVPLPLEVAWEGDSGKQTTSRISDISMSGCYVESLAQITVGEWVRFKIELALGEWLPLSGIVVYAHPQIGFGVSFTTLTEGVKTQLAELIEHARSGHP